MLLLYMVKETIKFKVRSHLPSSVLHLFSVHASPGPASSISVSATAASARQIGGYCFAFKFTFGSLASDNKLKIGKKEVDSRENTPRCFTQGIFLS